jgi:hypothetical protein
MTKKTRDVDLGAISEETAPQYAERTRRHFAGKAEHNKHESLTSFLVVIVATLAVSGFVAFGNDTLTSKIIPLCLSLLATATSTWLQFRKPHQLWAIYRSAQRYVEHHIVQFRYKIGDYEQAEDREKLLAKHVSQIALAAHEMWVPLVPSPEGLERLRTTPAAQLVARPGDSHEAPRVSSGKQIDAGPQSSSANNSPPPATR